MSFGLYHFAKWYAFQVDIFSFVGYTTNRTISQKRLGRYCKPSLAKKRNGSFLICIQNLAALNEAGGVLFCVRAVDLLHIVEQESVLCRPQIEHGHHRLSILRLHAAKKHQTAVVSAPGLAFQNQHRVFQNLRDALHLPQRDLRVIFQNGLDLVAVHVDVTLHRAQPLQRRAGRAKSKRRAIRLSIPVPLAQFLPIILRNGILRCAALLRRLASGLPCRRRHVPVHPDRRADRPFLRYAHLAPLVCLLEFRSILFHGEICRVAVYKIRRCQIVIAVLLHLTFQIGIVRRSRCFVHLRLGLRRLLPGILLRVDLGPSFAHIQQTAVLVVHVDALLFLLPLRLFMLCLRLLRAMRGVFEVLVCVVLLRLISALRVLCGVTLFFYVLAQHARHVLLRRLSASHHIALQGCRAVEGRSFALRKAEVDHILHLAALDGLRCRPLDVRLRRAFAKRRVCTGHRPAGKAAREERKAIFLCEILHHRGHRIPLAHSLRKIGAVRRFHFASPALRGHVIDAVEPVACNFLCALRSERPDDLAPCRLAGQHRLDDIAHGIFLGNSLDCTLYNAVDQRVDVAFAVLDSLINGIRSDLRPHHEVHRIRHGALCRRAGS